ncbi:hypothetical protein [Nocardia gipuzkoensis]|uniref:hypothetical protein n=1 Tax=Nocardia gipuzkoensis TaxID=2749991 RepID=UPI003EE021EA
MSAVVAGGIPANADDYLFRRIPKKPPYLETVDPIDGTKKPHVSAFSYDARDVDGLSVYVERLLIQFEIASEKLCRDWDAHGVARFSAAVVYAGGAKIWITPDVDDPVLGKAHASIPKPNGWKSLRLKIISSCEYFAVDPKCSP